MSKTASTDAPARPVGKNGSTGFKELIHITASSPDVEEVFKQLSQLVKRRVNYDWLRICYYTEREEQLHVRFIVHDNSAIFSSKTTLPLHSSIPGEAVLSGRPILRNDLPQQSVDADERSPLTETNLDSMLAVPLMSKGRALGTLDLARRAPGKFSQAELNRVENIASCIGIVVERAWMLEESKELAKMEERSRLEREVNDTIIQPLIRIVLQLEVAERRLRGDDAAARLEIRQACELAYKCLEDIRHSVLGLRPATHQTTTVTSQIPVGKNGSMVTAPREAERLSQGSSIRVLVVNDQALFRQGLRQILGQMPDIKIVGEAAEATEAMEKVQSLRPDVAIVDVQLREGSGIEFAAALNEQGSGTRSLILSARRGSDLVLQAIRAGASGYLLKDIAGSALADAIRAVHRGEMLLHPAAKSDFATSLGSPNGGRATESLTAREKDVLSLIACGLRNKEIARRLKLTEATIKYHVTHLLGKLGVDSRTEAIITAQKRGLIMEEYGA